MGIYKGALALLGKSETDAAVVDYLKSLGATLPLTRPPRGEKETNVEVPGQQIQLLFYSRKRVAERDALCGRGVGSAYILRSSGGSRKTDRWNAFRSRYDHDPGAGPSEVWRAGMEQRW